MQERDTCGDQHEEQIYLNTDHPYVKDLLAFMGSAPQSVVDAYFARMHRRGVFESEMENIGGLTKYRRKLVTRALLRMFRAGYISGRREGRRESEGAENGQ